MAANTIKKWVIAIAIAIVFNLFVNYGIATFYPGPDYTDFCKENPRAFPINGQVKECTPLNVSQEVQNNCSAQKGYIAYIYDSNGCATEAYCETCQAEFEEVRESHDANVFIALIIVAVIILGAGIAVKAEAVSTGFLLAGVLDLLIASIRYWEHLQNVYRFILLGIVLVILIWFGYRKIK